MESLIVAAVAVLVALVALARARRHAARRAAEARERTRRRRRSMPLVSANLRGLPQEREDMWKLDTPVGKDRAA